jgi:glycerol-3-phosphate O-acyltransferase
MILSQPFVMAVRVVMSWLLYLVFRRGNPDPFKTSFLRRLVSAGKSAIIHLGNSEFYKSPATENAVDQLMEAARDGNARIIVVPTLIAYGRRREKEDENIVNIVFGQQDSMGTFRRLLLFLRYANKAQVIAAEPIDLAEYLKSNNLPTEQLYQNLRGELINRIDEEKTSMVGPVLKSRQEIINLVLNDETLVPVIRQIAEEEKKEYHSVARRAEKYLQEIAADYDEMYIEFFDVALTWLWNNIYDGLIVDREGMAKIRSIAKKMPVVVIPCHRSHIDYLLLSYVFYKHNIQLPFVAAGANMQFWPMGSIFRKCGAFFLRRSFKGNALYGDVFSKYLKRIIQEGITLEFFIEGGRSRTGKMAMPKYGLLSMIIQAFQEGAANDLAAIPIYVGYDRVIEESSYLKELGGEDKSTERATDVIKSRKVLRKRYGHVYLNIGDPIFIKSYMSSMEKTYAEMTTEERQSLYRKIGYEIVLAINRVSVVTPFSFIAAGLLCHDRRGISYDDLMEVLSIFRDYLNVKQVKLAVTFTEEQKSIENALILFDQAGFISRIGEDEEVTEDIEEIVYSLEDDKRLSIEYYKNNILHYFLPASFLAVSVLSRTEDMIRLNELMDDYVFLKRLFRHEFIYDDIKDDAGEINELVSYFSERGMIDVEEKDGEAWIELTGIGRKKMMPFAGLVLNYIESYWVAVRGCAYLRKEDRSERDFMKKLRNLGAKLFQKGEIRRAEALSQANYANALRFLQSADIVTVTEVMEKGSKRATKFYSLADDRSRLEALRRRLFSFM